MLFILLMIATTLAVAGSAAFFSVYGLANTYSGVFWSVIVMGASLEAAKLVGASFLYRSWTSMTSIGMRLLKYYMAAGVLALMFLTSAGIFGYLSSGYQADVLPLKQKEAQIKVLEEERGRIVERKKQIDNLMAAAPTVQNLERQQGVDPNALRALQQAQRNRESLLRQYRVEQQDVTKRLGELDQQMLVLRQEIIKTEAHIGPITYIAKAFNESTDTATKWLTLLIIFAFDPMAVALTLGLNMLLLQRMQAKEAGKVPEKPVVEQELPVVPQVQEVYNPPSTVPDYFMESPAELPIEPPVEEAKPLKFELIDEPVAEQPTEQVPNRVSKQLSHILATTRWQTNSKNALNELINYYRLLKTKPQLTGQELIDKRAIENVLRERGLLIYLDD